MLRYLFGGLALLLRGSRRELVAHDELQHAHWDRAQRRWLAHEEADETIATAA